MLIMSVILSSKYFVYILSHRHHKKLPEASIINLDDEVEDVLLLHLTAYYMFSS